MSFLSFGDETALYKTVIFPYVFDRYYALLFDQRPLTVEGRLTNYQGVIILELARVEGI